MPGGMSGETAPRLPNDGNFQLPCNTAMKSAIRELSNAACNVK